MDIRNRYRLSKLTLALIVALAAAPALAQNTSSALDGRISNASGQPVAGADVTILHTPSGTVSHVTSDENGRYSASGLRVGGPYTVTISKGGETETQKDVYLQLAETKTVDLQLVAGAAAGATNLGAIEVKGTRLAAVFNPDNKGLTTNISQRELQVLPNADRSIQDVARLDPAITVTSKSRGEFSALGQNSRYNNITIDAVPTNDSFGLEANGLPSLNQPISYDAIEAYNISPANYDVTSKRAVGANVNIVTKSGGNEFHGSFYYVYKNANSMIGKDSAGNKFTGYQKQDTKGFTVGGPIIPDKLFFFANYEESKQVAPGSTRGPLASGKLTQAQLDQIISTATGYGLTPGNLSASSVNQDEKKYLAKLDWNVADGHRLSLRWNRANSTQPIIQSNSDTTLNLSSFWYFQHRDLKSTVLNSYDDWSDRFSTEASISSASYFATPMVLAQQPQIQVAIPGTGARVNLGEEQFRDYNVLNVKTRTAFFAGTLRMGDHSIKAGFDYQQDKFFNLFGRTEFGAYTFASPGDFASGKYSSFSLFQPRNGDINSIAANWTLSQWGFFAQDTWQIHNLSLQYGLRYDLPQTDHAPPYNASFKQAYGFANNGTIDGNGVLEPRISFNYSFDTKRMTQLRGGLGLSEGVTPGVWLSNPYTNNGLSINTYFATSGTFVANPFAQQPPPTAPGAQQAVDSVDPNFKLPTVLKFSLGFDRELPFWGTEFSADYAHLQVQHGIFYQYLNLGTPNGMLPDGRDNYWSSTLPSKFTNPTRPGARQRVNANPAFSTVTYLTNTDKGSTDFLSLQLRKPFSESWFGNVGVVFGHSTEVNPGTSSQATSNFTSRATYNPNENVAARSNYDISKRFVASLTWQHHFFGNYNTSISGFFDAHPGQPYSWVFANDANGDGITNNDLIYIPRPGDIEFATGTTQQVQDQFYSFIQHDSYLKSHQGDVAQRNGASSPWVNQIDLSFRQEIPGIFKGNKGELRLDLYNFGNLLNKKWGNVQAASFSGGGGFSRDLASFAGVDPATGKYVYSLPTVNGHYAPENLSTDNSNAVSRWSLQVTLRYTF